MLQFFGKRKDAKKPAAEKDPDGGFVVIGETTDEQRRRLQNVNIAQPSTNVIVQPYKLPQPKPAVENLPSALVAAGLPGVHPAVEVNSALPDLLGDVPFMLAPHVLAKQAGSSMVPDVLLSRDINYNLASFQYDFTLENSVLHNS